MASEPSVSPADTIRRLTEWSDDALHAGRSVRSHEPTYRNPGELRRDVRTLLAVGERDKAEIERLTAWADQYGDALVRIVDARAYEARDIARVALREPDNAALAAASDKVAERERDRRRVAQLTETLEQIAATDCILRGTVRSTHRGLFCPVHAARAVLAGEEDADG